MLGETGEMPDAWREAGRFLSVAHQMLFAPDGSLIQRVANAAIDIIPDQPTQGLFWKCSQLLNK